MQGYKSYYKRKNLKLRYIIISALIFFILYYLITHKEKFSFFSNESKLKNIEKILEKSDKEKEISEKKILIQKAISKLNKIEEKENLASADVYFLLGKAHFKKAMVEYNDEIRDATLEKAIYFYRKSLALLKSDNGLIHFELGKCYFYKGEYYYYESLMEFEKAQKLGYFNEYGKMIIDFIKYKKGNISEISELLKNFQYGKKESMEKIFYEACSFKDVGDYAKAKEYFLKIANFFNSNPVKGSEHNFILYRTYYTLGWLFLNEKNYKESENFYKLSLKINPNSYEAYYWLGKLYILMNKNREAKKMFEECLKLNSSYKPALDKLKELKKRR